MHEKSVMDSLMKKIMSLAEQEKAQRVTKVKVWLGALSHMTPDHFQEHFDISSKGTIAEGALIDAEMSSDARDPNAMHIVLKSIDVA